MKRGSFLSFSLLLAASGRADTLPVQGGQLYYETRGQGPTVVLIHGGFGDRRMWDAQFAGLAKGFRVVRYDHRGFGRSSFPTKAYSPGDDLVRLLDRVGAPRAHVVGNSMGGTLAVDFALKHPDRVDRLVIVASGPSGQPVSPEAMKSILRVFDTARHRGTREAAQMWLEHPMVAVASQDPHARGLLRQMVLDNREMLRIEYWPEEPMEPKAAARLGEVKAPTLVILGDRDTETVKQGAELLAKGIPGARLVVLAGTDHLPQMEKPAEVESLLREFLSRP